MEKRLTCAICGAAMVIVAANTAICTERHVCHQEHLPERNISTSTSYNAMVVTRSAIVSGIVSSITTGVLFQEDKLMG